MIMRSYLLDEQPSVAKEYFNMHKDDFKLTHNLNMAQSIYNRNKNKKNIMDYYYLFR